MNKPEIDARWQKVFDKYEQEGASMKPMYNGYRGEEVEKDSFFQGIREICEREYAKLKTMDKLRVDYVSLIDRQILLYGCFSPEEAVAQLMKKRGIEE